MRVFGLDTTRKSAKIFINDDEKNIDYTLTMDEKVKHSEGLFLYIEKALFETGFEIGDFDYLACVVGPGSFTGIRVGMSTIKGFNKAKNKKIVPINTFEILASTCKNSVVLLNSTNTSCYYAKIKNKSIVETGVVNKTDIVDKFQGFEFVLLKEEQNLIGVEYNNTRIIDDLSVHYMPAVSSKVAAGIEEVFVPYYLQLSQAERNLKNE